MSCGQDGLYMNNLCRSWADAFDGFRYTGIALNQTIPELKDNPEKSCTMVETHLNEVIAMYDDLSEYDIYISAPSPAIKLFRDICMKKNLLPGRFFEEPVRGNEDMSCIVSLQDE